MRIVVLTSQTPANVWLVNQLMARHRVVGVVIEHPPAATTRLQKYQRRRELVRRYGLPRTINKLAYNWMSRRFLAGSSARIVSEALFPDGVPSGYIKPTPSITVASVNDIDAKVFIEGLAPDALAVCGTRIIRPDVFSLAPRGALNIHTGITPEYRSADPIFWALYHGEPEKVGVTIHFIDRGVDTGPIVLQEAVPVYAEDSIASIYARCIQRGAALYSRALDALAMGTITTVRKASGQSRAFLSVDLGILQYMVFKRRFPKLARRLPSVNAADGTALSEDAR